MTVVFFDNQAMTYDSKKMYYIFDEKYLTMGLRELTIYECINIIKFPESLPDTLENLTISHCVIRKLGENRYPPNLKRLEVRHCHTSSIISIPDGLDYLDLGENKITDMTKCVAKKVQLYSNQITVINVISKLVKVLGVWQNPIERIETMAEVESIAIGNIDVLDMTRVTASTMNIISAGKIIGNSGGKVKTIMSERICFPDEDPSTVSITTALSVYRYPNCKRLEISGVQPDISLISPSVEILVLKGNIKGKVYDLSATNVVNLHIAEYGGAIIFPPRVEKLSISLGRDNYDFSDLHNLRCLSIMYGRKFKRPKIVLPHGLEYLDFDITGTLIVNLVDTLKIVNSNRGKFESPTRPKCIYLGLSG